MAACSSGSGDGKDATLDHTSGQDALTDVALDLLGELPGEVGTDALHEGTPGEEVADEVVDREIDVTLPEFAVKVPYAKPADPLADAAVESCALFHETRCVEGTLQRCDIYNPGQASWVDEPDPMLERAFLYDRWRDLYNSPDGQAVDRDFNREVLPLTPESEWGSPEYFEGYWGAGDGGIWTGWATVAAILRYVQTGTRADYQRMEQQVRDLVTMYDVTGVPGYLCRSHYLLMPAGAPNHPDHILRWEGNHNLTHHHRPVVHPESIENLPAIYTDGIEDAEGTVWKGTPMWHGRPSIDQNTGPMTALPMAYALLEDEVLKEKIVHHLTCYLKRLQRIELINLQDNPELIQGLLAYFSIGELQMDPDDIDLTGLEKIVGYVNRQINSKNEATFDISCPETVQLEPWRVIDATSPTFILDLLDLINDMDTDAERPNTIDHYYWPSIRGGDAMHLMHLASMAWYFTGDDMYRDFLFDELIGEIDTVAVMRTAGAFDLPKYCKKYYGDQITFGPWWAFLELLDVSQLKTDLMTGFHWEYWRKLVRQVGNVDFNIMYAGAVDPDIAVDREEALGYAMEQLPWMGGNGGLPMGSHDDPKWLQDPRRSYSFTPDQVMAVVPSPITEECPTQHQVDICAAEVEFMGVKLPNLTGWKVYACGDKPNVCPLEGEDGCAQVHSSHPLPVHLRRNTDYLWQRNAFGLGAYSHIEGKRQYAGSDYSVPYWNARNYGFITDGAGTVLAWRPDGTCE
jgi:hypothetical protein